MRRTSVTAPTISENTLYFFSRYVEWYLRRNFHAVRMLHGGFDIRTVDGPLVVCLNHPGWWDPLIALLLARRLMPNRKHYAPIEAKSLEKYRLFERIGFFGVEAGTASGAANFLRVGRAVLARPDSVLWITAQGQFTDARHRPVSLRGGAGHLMVECPRATLVPLALEYSFWEERFPEALCTFGAPVPVETTQPAEYTAAAAAALERTLDRLAASAVARDRSAFEVILGGTSGVGGIYDAWRRVTRKTKGQEFRREHGTERI